MDTRGFDLFTIGEIAILDKKINNSSYDFDFRNYFECRTVYDAVNCPVLLHIGAISDYAEVEKTVSDMGMYLLVTESEHLKSSMIEKWYPILKEKTPYTVIYDELPEIDEILTKFRFPIFIKGNRQTNRHKKSQCIINNVDEYEKLKQQWKHDEILSWQSVAVREFVKLKLIDDKSYPDMVPISYEFRFFCFEGKCVAYGNYWSIGNKYSLDESDKDTAKNLAQWAAQKLSLEFVAVDLAKTESGEWIIIEVNDAQESGFAGVNPYNLWSKVIEKCQNREWISASELSNFSILSGDPIPDKFLEQMKAMLYNVSDVRELIKIYIVLDEKVVFKEDEIYDFDEGTQEQIEAEANFKKWFKLMKNAENRLIEYAKAEKMYIDDDIGLVKKLEPFMKKYGYRNVGGWWIK